MSAIMLSKNRSFSNIKYQYMKSSQYYPVNEYVKKKPLDIDTFLDIAIEICKSVHELHKQNLLFNNLTPSTIMINKDHQVKISKATSSDDTAVTVDYMSPEQVLKDSTYINQSSDIYVLGIIFYELLLGELPYKYNDILAFTHAVLTQKIPFISDENIPHMISLIIEKMVAINQLERYKDILSVSIDLIKVRHAFEEDAGISNFQIDTFHNI